jgi:glycosyltransferase involved in cell wall biosynthesis
MVANRYRPVPPPRGRPIPKRPVKGRAAPPKPTGTCAVIMAAHGASRWIADCLASIRAQKMPDGWSRALRIGVDGCRKTAATLDSLGVPYYLSEKNVGTYVMRNSLIAMRPADCYAIFDADDIMCDDYLRTLIALAGLDGIGGSARRTINGRGQLSGNTVGRFHSGVCGISHGAWTALGAYRPERLASDVDFMARAELLKIPVRRTSFPLYLRRRHAASLTQADATGIGSKVRKDIVAGHRRLRATGGLVVPLVTIPLTARLP